MFSLHPNRELLNPKFEGYKLDPVSQEDVVIHHGLQYKPTQAAVSGRAPLSFQEAQSRIRHNHLAVEPTSNRAAFIDAELRVILVTLDGESLQPSFTAIHELPTPMQTPSSEAIQSEYPSLAFLDAQTLFVSDGYGTLYVLKLLQAGPAQITGTYELPTISKAGLSDTPPPFRIHTSVKLSDDTCAVLLSSKRIKSTDDTAASSAPTPSYRPPPIQFDVFAARFPIIASEPVSTAQSLDIIWRRRGSDVPIYLAYDQSRNTFLLAGGSTYQPIGIPLTETYEPSADEFPPIPRADQLAGTETPSLAKPPPYAWTQDSEELTIAFPLPSTTAKSDINVHFSPQTLTILIRGEGPAAEDLPRYSAVRLWGGISTSSSFWTWDAHGSRTYGLLTLHLEKQHEGTRWAHVFDAAATGAREEVPETLDPSELYHIQEALEKYTASLQDGRDTSGLGLGGGVPSLAEGELDDEVDASVGSTVCLTWVGADGSTPTWAQEDRDIPLTVLSTPLPGSNLQETSLMVKHTIDGALFTLTSGEASNWTHSSTYSALAFVLASKRDTRFTHHVSSKAMLAFEGGSADYGGNLYIYRHAKPKAMWAKQAILKLGGGAAGSVLGVGALNAGGARLVVLCLCEGELVIIRDIL